MSENFFRATRLSASHTAWMSAPTSLITIAVWCVASSFTGSVLSSTQPIHSERPPQKASAVLAQQGEVAAVVPVCEPELRQQVDHLGLVRIRVLRLVEQVVDPRVLLEDHSRLVPVLECERLRALEEVLDVERRNPHPDPPCLGAAGSRRCGEARLSSDQYPPSST